jgi:4-aminobutyrate--pyruvate transaminase
MTEQHLWHPFADMAQVPGHEVTLVSGAGAWVTDEEPLLDDRLAPLARHALVEEIRTIGLLAGVELSAAARSVTPDLTERLTRRARGHGVLVRNLVGHTLQISPPFVIAPDELTHLADVLQTSLDEVAAELGAGHVPATQPDGDHEQTA